MYMSQKRRIYGVFWLIFIAWQSNDNKSAEYVERGFLHFKEVFLFYSPFLLHLSFKFKYGFRQNKKIYYNRYKMILMIKYIYYN